MRSNSSVQATVLARPWTFVAIHRDFVLRVEGFVGAEWGVVVSMEVCTLSADTRPPADAADVLPVFGQEKVPPPRRTFLTTSFIVSIAADDCWLLY